MRLQGIFDMNEGQMLDPIVELWYLIAKLYFTIYFRIDKPVKLIQFVYLGGEGYKISKWRIAAQMVLPTKF